MSSGGVFVLQRLSPILLVTGIILALGLATATSAQKPGSGNNTAPPPPLPPPPPRAPTDSFDQTRLRYERKGQPVPPQAQPSDYCFLPPLNSVRSASVEVANLRIPPKAKRHYQ